MWRAASWPSHGSWGPSSTAHSPTLFSSVNLISLWAMNVAAGGWPGGTCWGVVGCWEDLPPAGVLEGLGGCVDESRFRLSTFTPSSFLDFPAKEKRPLTASLLVRQLPACYLGEVSSAHTASPLGTPRPGTPCGHLPFSFLVWAGVGDRELAEDTGLARSAYMSSESTLCAELLLDVALDTEDTLLTLSDLHRQTRLCPHSPEPQGRGTAQPEALGALDSLQVPPSEGTPARPGPGPRAYGSRAVSWAGMHNCM